MLFSNTGKVSYHAGDTITSGVAAPQVGNRNLQSLIDANPYRNAQYTVSPWNQFLNWLGFRTPADAWKENMAVQANEYDAAILQKQYDQEYNDPASQVERMRLAGLNPDIDGGSNISPGQAAPLGEDPSTPMQSSGDDVQLMNFANGIMSAFSTAVGMVSSFQGIYRQRLQNSLLLDDLAQDKSLDFIPRENPELTDDPNTWQNVALGNAKAFAKINLPRSQRSRFLRSIQAYWQGVPADVEARKAWLERERTRKGYAKETSENWSPFDDVLRAIWKPLGEVAEKYYAKHQEAELKGAEADYEENENREVEAATLDPVAKANAENSTNVNKQQNEDIQFLMKNAFKEIMDNLKSVANDGGPAGSAAHSLLLILSLREMELLPRLKDFIPFLSAR